MLMTFTPPCILNLNIHPIFNKYVLPLNRKYVDCLKRPKLYMCCEFKRSHSCFEIISLSFLGSITNGIVNGQSQINWGNCCGTRKSGLFYNVTKLLPSYYLPFSSTKRFKTEGQKKFYSEWDEFVGFFENSKESWEKLGFRLVGN